MKKKKSLGKGQEILKLDERRSDKLLDMVTSNVAEDKNPESEEKLTSLKHKLDGLEAINPKDDKIDQKAQEPTRSSDLKINVKP